MRILIIQLEKANFHSHIPNLLDFALDKACTDVVKHGIALLTISDPKPLYRRCLKAFVEKYDDLESPMKLYHKLRERQTDRVFEIKTYGVSCVLLLLDHVMLTETYDITNLFTLLIRNAENDTGHAVACINTLVTRCAALNRSDLLSELLNTGLTCHPCKEIRDALIQHGAKLDQDDDEYLQHACSCGSSQHVKSALKNGQKLDYNDVIFAIESGNSDIINYLWKSNEISKESKAVRDLVVLNGCNNYFNARDFSVDYCRLLLDVGVFKHGKTI